MAHHDRTKPFYIDCAASLVNLGAALHQRDAYNKEDLAAFANQNREA